MSNPLMGMMGGMPGGNSPLGMIQRMMGMMQNAQNPGAMLLCKWECDVSERYITT